MTDKKRSHTSRSSRSPSPEKNTERIGKKHAPDAKPKKKKRSRSSSSDSCTDSENDSSSSVSIPSKHESKKKRKKLSKKKEKKKKKKSKKKLKKDKQKFKKVSAEIPTVEKTKSPVVKKIESTDETDRLLLDRAKAMAPMTKEEWEKRQSIIRKVYDEETGRYRLIKGDGEVLEEIVSRDRHREINKQATRGDGAFFQATIAAKLNK